MDGKIRVCSDKSIPFKNNLVNFLHKIKNKYVGIYDRVTQGRYFQNHLGLFILNLFCHSKP